MATQPQTKARNWSGRTEDAGSAILGAPYWQPGVTISGIYVRSFMTAVGECHEFMAVGSPKARIDDRNRVVSEGGKEITLEKFAMGALTGFEMALQAVQSKGYDGFRFKDQVTITCTKMQPSPDPNKSDMPVFELDITRP